MDETLNQLQRRIDCERRARRRVEQVAEAATRDLDERQAELELLEAVAVAANEATTIEEAMRVAVERVCAHTGWPVGHVYVSRDEGSDLLRPSGVWHLDEPERYAGFRALTDAQPLPKGLDLPGRAAVTGAPVTICDVTEEVDLPRSGLAGDAGLRSAFAFPAMAGGEVMAVLEFFSPQQQQPAEAALRIIRQVAAELGRVIERRRREDDLRRLSRQNEMLLISAGEGIFGLDARGRATFVNPAAARMLGTPADRLVGTNMLDALTSAEGARPSAENDSPLRSVVLGGEGQRSDDAVLRRADGNTVPVAYIGTPIFENGTVSGAVVTFNDISERKRFERQLHYLADHDALTGLYNRRRFEEELSAQLARTARYGARAAVLMLDLDNFKYVNDTLGHAAGDDLVRAVAGLLQRRLRKSDTLARLGGDEFAILLREVDEPRARLVAGKLVDAVRKGIAPGRQPMRVTASVGLTLVDGREVTAEELVVEADVAMYEAKDGGRDQLAVYTPGKGRRGGLQAGLPWVERIKRALDEELFVMYAQPIVSLAGNQRAQFELLVRMRGDGGEIIAPGAFLPTAERFGLVHAIDRWVVRQAIELAARRADLVLEVNLSGRSFGEPDLPDFVEAGLREAGVEADRLVFEITETAAIANIEAARQFATRLTGLGCRFALDDFGAGFGSFYYLKYLPLHFLKIDGDFIRNLPNSQVDQRMVRAMVDVADGLGMKTIAEFVGDEPTVELLRAYGVDYGQGFYLGHPRPASELIASTPVSARTATA